MQGARWGWVAFIAAVAVLFAASSHDQSATTKIASLLRQELKTTLVEKEQLQTERNQAYEQVEWVTNWSYTQELELLQAKQELRRQAQEKEKLRKELTSLSQDRNQLQQTIASLQLERSQTKRSVEQLRQGLHQLLSQADAVAGVLEAPVPGFAQISFEAIESVDQPAMPCGQAARQVDASDKP